MGIVSCAPLGRSGKIYNPVKIKDCKNIGVIFFSPNNLNVKIKKESDDVFIKQVMERLRNIDNFNYLYFDRLQNTSLDKVSSDFYNVNDFSKFDCLLLIERDFLHPSYEEGESKCRLLLIDKLDKKVLLRASFNTGLGKSYMSYPGYKITTIDATNGLIDKFEKQLHKVFKN